jgi:hypothetical protein
MRMHAQELAKLHAMAYSWNGNESYLNASLTAFKMLDRFDVQVHGVNSAQEALSGTYYVLEYLPASASTTASHLNLVVVCCCCCFCFCCFGCCCCCWY